MACVCAATEKKLDMVLLPSDPAPEGIFRWPEGSALNLDGDGASIDGFTREDARPLHMADSLDAVVEWESGRTLEELSGAPVRLRFHMQAAKLYSFWSE